VTDAALVGRLLDEYHERSAAPAGILLTAGSVHEASVTYQLTLADGSRQLIRAFRADEPVPGRDRGLLPETTADWLLGRARTLACLAAADYPAPRPVRTRTGELVGVEGAWLSWGISRVPGNVIRPALSQLRALGATLGSLHMVAAQAGPDGRAGLASHHPLVALPAARARLQAVAGRVPADWQPLYRAVAETIDAVQNAAGNVAETLVHGDAWARTAVQSPGDDQVTLIDWETGGRGLAVLDLGTCLLECHLDATVPDPAVSLIAPDEDRIAAVAGGYASVRELSGAERALLPAAAAFAAAVAGAVHLELALLDDVRGPVMDARLARLRNRMEAAAPVAALALPHPGG